MTSRRLLTVLALSAIHSLLSITAHAQGSLTPPGAPAPTMKTLDQVEARTPVDATHTPGDGDSLFVISQSGSYYLTGSITGVAAKHGIKITAPYVTLDLGGFTLTGIAGSLSGIQVPGATPGLAISNGTVAGWKSHGIAATQADDSIYEYLHLQNNGTVNGSHSGLTGGGNCLLRDCTFENNAGNGLTLLTGCSVASCYAWQNAGTGVNLGAKCMARSVQCRKNTLLGLNTGAGSLISSCEALDNEATGITAGEGSLVFATRSTGNKFYGIFTGQGCRVADCTSYGNGTTTTHTGILTGAQCQVSGCIANFNTGDGVRTGAQCRVTDVIARTNGNGVAGRGIVTGIRSTVSGSTVTGHGANGILVAGDCIVRRCRADANGGISAAHGIHSTGSGSLIEDNTTSSNTGYGILCDGGAGADTIVRNVSTSNATGNYSPASGTQFGPLQAPNTATSPFANF